MTSPSFRDLCVRVDKVFTESEGAIGSDNHKLASEHAHKLSALESPSWHDFILVEAATHIPFHHFVIDKCHFLVSKGEYESTPPPHSTLRDMTTAQHWRAHRDLLHPCNLLLGHPIFDALYSRDVVHSLEQVDSFITIRLIVQRHGSGVTAQPSRIRKKATGFRLPHLFDWVAFNLLATADLSLPSETQEQSMAYDTWVLSGDDNYFREQQKLDPIVHQLVYCAHQTGHRSISALIISSLVYMRTELQWPNGVKGFREDVAIRERAANFDQIEGMTLHDGYIILRTLDYRSYLSLALVMVSITTAAISVFALITGRHILAAACICFFVIAFSASIFSGLRLDPARESGWFICTKRKTASPCEASRIVGAHPSIVWTSLLAHVLSTWPKNNTFLEVLWQRKSRLSDWLDAGAKTAVTRDGRLALHLAENVLLVLREDDSLCLQNTEWDDWYERHFSYRRFLGVGEEDFNFSLIYFEGDVGTRVDDDVSHIQAFGLRYLWRCYLLLLTEWRTSKLYAKRYRPQDSSLLGLPIRDPGIEGITKEAKYIGRVLRTNRIPAMLPVRVDMQVSKETGYILSPHFMIEDLDSAEVYEQLFDYEKVKEARVPSDICEEDSLCLAISYRHHIGKFSNRMPKEVWSMEIPHIRQLLRFYGATKVRFWTDTRLSKLQKGEILDWVKVGLAPYGQMHVYIVNSHISETLVDRFWLTAERKLGMAVGGAHYTADDGKLTVVTAGIEDSIDVEVLTALSGVLASAGVLEELYRKDKLSVIKGSVNTLQRMIGPEWKEIVLDLPWELLLFDVSHDFAERQFDERDLVLEENWNPAVDVLLSRRVLVETGEDVSFPSSNITTDLYLNTEEEDGKSYVAILHRREDEVAAVDLRATMTSTGLKIRSVGKARLVGPEYLAQMDEAGLRKVEHVL